MTGRHRFIGRAAMFAFAGCCAALATRPALAQTASQITRESYAPPLTRPAQGGGLSIAASSGLDTPSGAETLSVTPSGLDVEGALPALSPETNEIAARLTNKRVTGAELFSAARDLEAAYARAGYLLVRVTLPPQTIKDGLPLKLVVIEGRVSAIDASALPGSARTRIEAMLAPLVGRTGPIGPELERRLLLAGDTPGVMLRSTLKAGDKPATTVIVVDGRYDPVTASVSLDNGISSNLGGYTVGLGTDFNNVFALGETFYLRLFGYPGFNDSIFDGDPRNRQIVAGVTLPLGTDGWWLNLEGVDSRTHSDTGLVYSIPDHFQRFTAKTGYNWVRSRDFNTASVIGFDIADEEQTIDIGGVRSGFSEDRMRVLRLTQTMDTYTSWGSTLNGAITASFGIDGLGARNGTALLPLSRDGVQPDFAKLDVSGRYNQAFSQNGVQLSVSGKAQTSFGDPLVSSEQFGLGGFDWLSAFESGALQGDTGAAIRAELAFPTQFDKIESLKQFGAAVSPYVFAAAGVAKLERPSAVETGVTRAAAFGTGIRFGVAQSASAQSASLVLEYAHGAASGLDSENRFNLRFVSQF